MGSIGIVVGLAILAYLGVGGTLYYIQDALIFPAPGGISTAAMDEAAAEVGATPIEVETSDGLKLYGWYRGAGNKRAVVYFHGNAGSVLGTVGLMRAVNDEGWDFAAINYRGYPGSDGAPSEAGLLKDAKGIWDYLRDVKGIAAEDIVLHGRSLGGGVAAGLATEVQAGGVVLESSFTSVLEIAQKGNSWFPVSFLLRHPFDTRGRSKSIGVPVLVMHSDGDDIIPVSHGRELGTLFSAGQYIEIPRREHNDGLIVNCPEGRAAYLKFLEKAAGS